VKQPSASAKAPITSASTENTAQTNQINKVNSGNNDIVDLRIGDNKNYSRLVIESKKPINYILTQNSDDSFTLSIDNIKIDDAILTRLNRQIKRISAAIESIKVTHDQDDVKLMIKLKNEISNVKKVQYKSNNNNLVVLDFVFE